MNIDVKFITDGKKNCDEKYSDEEIQLKKTLGKIKFLLNPESTYKKKYVLFDSKYRITSGDFESNISSFQWLYNDIGIPRDGTATAKGRLGNIVSIRICTSEIKPFLTSNLNILIDEFKTQSYHIDNILNAHWIFYGGPNDNNSESKFIYTFSEPVPIVDRFTFSFNDGVNPLTIPFDRDTATITYLQGQNDSPRILLDHAMSYLFGAVDANHYVRMTITGFTTLTPEKDAAFIKFMSPPYVVTGIVYPGQWQFPEVTGSNQIQLLTRDTYYISQPPPGLKITVYFEDYRIQIPTEITYIDN